MNIKDFALDITEQEYRKLPAFSYSTIAKYERTGFKGLETLFDRESTPSLSFGSLVDTLITAPEEFESKFYISNLTINEKAYEFSNKLKELNIEEYNDDILYEIGAEFFSSRFKKETVLTKIKETFIPFIELQKEAEGKTIVQQNDYYDAMACVSTLKTNSFVGKVFGPLPFGERHYQLKFKHTFDGIDYKCMFDCIIVDHENKRIYPYDLKTSSNNEYDFAQSFRHYHYDIQSRLYWRILNEKIKGTGYTLAPFCFIVINRLNKIPLIWKYNGCSEKGSLTYDSGWICRDPEEITKELQYYLTEKPVVPKGIEVCKINTIDNFI